MKASPPFRKREEAILLSSARKNAATVAEPVAEDVREHGSPGRWQMIFHPGTKIPAL
jgi:hypothetical protein